MLIKLLKYDLKYMIKNMSLFYLLSIFFALTTRIFFSIKQTAIINIIGQISVGCMFSMIASVLINTIMRSFVRFRDFFYKDESYLTHTLPVTKDELYNSKLIQTFIFSVIGFVVILLSLFIAFYSKDNIVLLINYLKNIQLVLNTNITFFIVIITILLFLELFNIIQCGFLGTVLGYKKNNKKLEYSVLFGFIIYLLSQLLVVILIYIYGLFDFSVMKLFKSNQGGINSFRSLFLIATLIYIIVILIISVLSKKELNKGVDVL